MADRAWMSTFIDFNQDGFIDSLAIEKEVFVKEKNLTNLLIGVREIAKDIASLYIFKM